MTKDQFGRAIQKIGVVLADGMVSITLRLCLRMAKLCRVFITGLGYDLPIL